MRRIAILSLWGVWLMVTFWLVMQDHMFMLPVILGMGIDFIGAWYLREVMREERRAARDPKDNEDATAPHRQ